MHPESPLPEVFLLFFYLFKYTPRKWTTVKQMQGLQHQRCQNVRRKKSVWCEWVNEWVWSLPLWMPFGFVDFSFLSLFFQEVVKTAGMWMCISKLQYSSPGTSLVESVLFLQLSCGILQDGQSLAIQVVTILSPTFLKTCRASLFIVWSDLS